MALVLKKNLNTFNKQMLHLYNLKYLMLFDVTLRDGLQSVKECYNLNQKKQILDSIIEQKNPQFIEIGSIVSPKILPQMENSIELYKYATTKYNRLYFPKFYMLIPNMKALNIAKENKIKNISLITSVSDEFQKKNINKSLQETKKDISKMVSDNYFDNMKLYISCINKCPIHGIIDNNIVVDEILSYTNHNNINEFCISDTCGNLNFNNFKYIIDNVLKELNSEYISLHLHVSDDNIENVTDIINYAVNKKIIKFDVSYLDNIGGCTVTIKEKPNRNLTYTDLVTIL
jgi:hydroxymethylglutaryl-CoA lyase